MIVTRFHDHVLNFPFAKEDLINGIYDKRYLFQKNSV